MSLSNGRIHAEASVLTTLTPAAEPKALVISDNKNDTRPAVAADVYRAICQVAKEISRDGISKGRKNEQQGYGFRGIDDIMNALSALLAGADLVILPRMSSRVQDERLTAGGKILFYVTVQADFDFVSARDGSCHTVTMYGEAMDSADKATNKAMSAAYKYACLQVFCIPTEGMADADATTPQLAPKPQPPRPPAPTPQIDIGAARPNSAEASQYVAQQKLATGSVTAQLKAPWNSMKEVEPLFDAVRERVGEDTFFRSLEACGWRELVDIRNAMNALDHAARDASRQKARELYWKLDAIARKEGK